MKATLIFGLLPVVALLAIAGGCKSISRAFKSGGTLYVVEVVAGETDPSSMVDRVVRVTETRLDAVGIDGDVARVGGNRIEARIYGSQDPERVRNFLFKTYKLELKKVVSPPSPSPAQTYSDRAAAERAATADQQVLPYGERSDNAPLSYVIVEKRPIVTGEHIRSATAVSMTGSDFDYQVSFSLNTEGAGRFAEWTGQNINNYIAVVLNDQVQSVAYIKTQISDSAEITGRFSKAEAEAIATSLNSGYLPVELKIVEEKPFD